MSKSSNTINPARRRRACWLWASVIGDALLAVLGLSGLGYGIAEPSAAVGIFGAGLALLALILLTAAVLELPLLRQRPGAELGHTPEGAPALVVQRMAWTVPIAAAVTTALGLIVGAAGILALVRGQWLWGILLVLAGLWFLSYLVPLAAGRVTSGGLYFTSDGIEHRRNAVWWRVPWAGVESAALQGSVLALVLTDDAHVERRRTTRWGWQRSVRSPAGILAVETQNLSEEGATIVNVIVRCVIDREFRALLGTQRALDTVRSVRPSQA